MNKVIWMCWFQGENDPGVPELNRECIKKWRNLNTDWQVNILSSKTITDYVPEYFDIVESSAVKRTRAAKSDLLRLLLLSKYGGVWVDASVYPMVPLSDFYGEIVNQTGFFTYRFIPRVSNINRGDRETVSWFLCVDRPSHYIIEKWKTSFTDKFKSEDEWKYYTLHETLAHLHDNDAKCKQILNNMVQINQKIPHSAIKGWENRVDSFMYKRPKIQF